MNDILLPVETTNRELDAKLLLGTRLLNPERRVFIGSIRRLNRLAGLVKNGIYLGPWAMSPPDRHWETYYAQFKRDGFSFLYLVEEGGVWTGDETDWKIPLEQTISGDHIDRLAPDDWICAWGDFQADYYRRRIPQMAARVRVTGHPRFDLYASSNRKFFAEDAERIRKQYGPFVLINTNMGYANNQRGIENTFSKAFWYDANDSALRFRHLAIWQDSMRTLAAVVHLVHRLSAEFPKLNFILRPHPSESLAFYKAVFSGVKNIHALHEGSVGAWIMASEALIHDGCTTAIEAQLMDIPVLSLAFESQRPMEIRIANELGLRCESPAEVIQALRPLTSGEKVRCTPIPPHSAAKRLIGNFSTSALDTLGAMVDESLAATRGGEKGSTTTRLRLHEQAGAISAFPQKMVREFRSRLKDRAGEHKKFYRFRFADIDQRMRRIMQMTGTRVQWTLLGSEVISLTKR
ncbi:MAG: surface carbohydrate biosynthesis protein [Pseudomonadota bacterium]